jgi:hypothetical protein
MGKDGSNPEMFCLATPFTKQKPPKNNFGSLAVFQSLRIRLEDP